LKDSVALPERVTKACFADQSAAVLAVWILKLGQSRQDFAAKALRSDE
jgi:hypothetical protein